MVKVYECSNEYETQVSWEMLLTWNVVIANISFKVKLVNC